MCKKKMSEFISENEIYFEESALDFIKERLASLEDSSWKMIEPLRFIDPHTIFLISVCLGFLGIDRFKLGDTYLGIAKLLTLGGFGIWMILDWIKIKQITKRKNTRFMREVLTHPNCI